MEPPTSVKSTTTTDKNIADQPEAGPSTIFQPLNRSLSMTSNRSISSSSIDAPQKIAKRTRLKREGAQILRDAFNSGITRPNAEQKLDLLRSIKAIPGCEHYTIGSLEIWFSNRRSVNKNSKDAQGSVGTARRFPSLKAAALETLSTLFAESPRPSAELINVWATLLKATVEDVEAWVRAEQERLAVISTTSLAPLINSSSGRNTPSISLNTNNEYLKRSAQLPSSHLSTPTSTAGSLQHPNSQYVLSPLLDYALPHLASLPLSHGSSSRASSLEASSQRPSASVSPVIPYIRNIPTSLLHLTHGTTTSRPRSPSLSGYGLPSPSLSASTSAAEVASQLHTPVTPVTPMTPATAELPFYMSGIWSTVPQKSLSSPPPPPPPSLPPPPSPPPPLTQTDRFLLYLSENLPDLATSDTGVSTSEGEGEDKSKDVQSTSHPQSASEFKALFAPFQALMEDFLDKHDRGV